MNSDSSYRISKKITVDGFGSCNVYYMKSGGSEKKHFHDGIEIVYIEKGTCKTHR
jgi:hypothetical protein